MPNPDLRRIAIVGVGAVGGTFAYTLLPRGLAGEITLVDKDLERAEGEALDLAHGLFFVPPVGIRAAPLEDCAGSGIFVITAGAKQRSGESRLDLVGRNAAIVAGIARTIARIAPEAIIVVVSNPVDILTYVALRASGFQRARVLGSGTVLDSARFRLLLSRHCRVDPRNVHAYVIGEHGDSEVPVWSHTNIGGVPIEDLCETCDAPCGGMDRDAIAADVRESAYHVIEAKGATNYAVSLALERIVASIIRNERSVLTVSTLLEGEYGIRGVCLSLPAICGSHGAGPIIASPLEEEERRGLEASARLLRETIDGLPEDRLRP
ncbi:MAG: L-lactate dehydrogenase [Planctomycetes bacterium]|nr:L-lactate dehydrogenase [Planctomycetota bacterium]